MLDLCLLCPIEILILQAAPYLCPSLLLPLLWHHAMSSMYLLQHPLLTQQFTPQSTLPPSLLSNPATDISLVFPPRTTPPTALVLPCQEIILMPHNMVGVSILAPQQPLPSLPHTLLLQVADIPTTQDILPQLFHPLPSHQEVTSPSPCWWPPAPSTGGNFLNCNPFAHPSPFFWPPQFFQAPSSECKVASKKNAASTKNS